MERVHRTLRGTPDNGRRQRLILGLGQMLVLLARANCRTIWLDGSFVTRERWPRDFDLCYDPAEMRDKDTEPILLNFSEGRRAQKTRFGGEALPYDFPLDWNGTTLLDGFKREKVTGKAKGLIRVDIQETLDEIERWVEEQQEAERP